MTQDSEKIAGLRILKERIANPVGVLASPFIPWLFNPELPLTGLLLFFSLIFYVGLEGKVLRKHVDGFQRWFLVILICSLVGRLVLALLPVETWIVPLLILPFAFVIWVKFGWSNWQKIYEEAQKLSDDH